MSAIALCDDGADLWDDYPIHIKNRSMLDKILFATPREKDVFLHEASHSFEFNIKAQISDKWDKFYEEFNRVQERQYNQGALYARAVLPFAGRPRWQAYTAAPIILKTSQRLTAIYGAMI